MYEAYYDKEANALLFSEEPVAGKDLFAAGWNVFVCAALQSPAMMRSLIGRAAPFAPAVVRGYRVTSEAIGGREYPFMIPDPDHPHGVLPGVVWLGLDEQDLANIEVLELEKELRRRIEIQVQVGNLHVDAITYLKR